MIDFRSTGSTVFVPWHLSNIARAYAALGQVDEAWRSVGEAISAIDATDERWREADVRRLAGEIARLSPQHDAKAEALFEHSLIVARQQQAKS